MSQGLIDKGRVELKLADYRVAPASALADPSLHPRVQDYRRQVGSRMYPLDKQGMRQRIPNADYHVSRKIDGEFTVLVYRDGESFTLNPGGTVRMGMPWQDEANRLLGQAGVKEAMLVGELYVACDERRPRRHDVTSVARQPESIEDLKRLRFAVFDLMSLDNQPPGDRFADTWDKIKKLFDGGQAIHPVEAVDAKKPEEIEKVFNDWVEEQGAEGLVVRSDTAGQFKIKSRHSIDVVVIGFTEAVDDRQGLLHDLLLAVMRRDGTLHVFSRVGGGFNDEQRRNMLSDLKDMVVESEYAEVNADHVAYQMVRPEWVVEVSCLDLISQTTRGGPVNRMVLDWNLEGSDAYSVVRSLPLVSVISPQFIRRREDKTVQFDDVRIQQIADLVEVPLLDRDARQMSLPRSKMLRREVYTKQLKGQTMVRKLAMWKTNKESESDEFPAYVVHYTDFSPNRKTPLNREVRVSNSREQIDALWENLKESNIKKGWNTQSAAATEEPAAESKPAKKSKKAAAEKATPAQKKAAAKKAEAQPKKKAAPKKKATAKKKTTAKKSSKKT